MDERAGRLDALVRATAPIDGISIGSWDDKATWRIAFQASATDDQKTNANALLAAFDPNGTLVPQSVSPWQAHAALIDANLIDAYESLIAQQSAKVRAKAEYATEWRRDDPTINALAAALFPTDTQAQLDALFIQAATYT